MQDRARIVIVGAGIVGCSTAYELTRLGWTDIVVVDQGPLFETGGSTSHAPGLVFQVNPSRTVSKLAQDTVRTYAALNVGEPANDPIWYDVGSFEVATTPERLSELHRRAGYARSWDLPARVIDPDEAVARLPILNRERVLGALHVPSDGVVRAVRAAAKMAGLAEAAGGATFHGNTAVTGIRIEGDRVTAVETTAGVIRTDRVLIATGIWGPIVGRMAGITMPLMPFRHLYAETEPLPELVAAGAGAPGSRLVEQPILRHQDRSMYFKQWGAAYGIGSYRHEELPIEAMDLARDEHGRGHAVAHLPSFPDALFENALEFTRDLLPAVGRAPLARRLNGVFSFTPDANSILGEWPETRGLWLAEAVWVTHGAGTGRLMAEWLVDGTPTYDVREVDVRRFAKHVYHRAYIRRRGVQQYREVYDIVHPLDQFTEPRGLRVSPFHARQRDLGAVFFEGAGWERPRWYNANAPLIADAHWRRGAWETRNWSPINGAEHLATRTAASMMDLSPFIKVRVSGRGALGFLQRIASSDLDRPVGRVTYTTLLNERGGITSDLTITRLAEDEFLVVDGAGTGLRTIGRIRDLAPADGSVRVADDTSGWCCVGIWGPRAQEIVDAVAEEPLAHGRFTSAEVTIGGVPALALRVSYVGEHGWELYAPTEYGLRLWDVLWEAGRPLGLVASGLAAQDSLRLEKGYRLWGQDIHTEFDPLESGLEFTVAWDKGDFLGREALVRKREAGLTRRLSALVLDDREVVLMNREPILVGDDKVGYVTSANYGYAVGRSIAYGYLPVALARPGQRVELQSFGVRYGATVAEEPLYDPTNERLRGPGRPTAAGSRGSNGTGPTNGAIAATRVEAPAGA